MTALKLLRDDDTVASVVCKALESVIGEGWLLWEPESIWKELKYKGVDVPIGNRQQIMAARGLLVHGRFFYDGLVFDRSCAAFSNEVLDIDELDETLAMHLAWGIDEAKKICELFEDPFLDLDREPITVVSAQLWEEGFIVAPDELSFAQPSLDREWPEESRKLKKEVETLWNSLRSHDLRQVPYPETPKGVQCARLAAVQVFLDERRGVRGTQLTHL